MRTFNPRVFAPRLFTPRLFGRAAATTVATDAVRIRFRIEPDLGGEILEVSGLDDLWMSANILSAVTKLPLQAGSVALWLCQARTQTLIDPSAIIDFAYEGGWWTATFDNAVHGPLVTALAEGLAFDMILDVPGRARTRVRRCRKVAVADA